MARGRDSRSNRREAAPDNRGKNRGLFTGLLIGLVIGLVIAAALAWYFYRSTDAYKPAAVAAQPAAPPSSPAPASSPPRIKPEPPKPVAKSPKPGPEPASAEPTVKPKSRVDLTFYDILPGDKPGKPLTSTKLPEPPASKEVWWLQVAALKNLAEVDRLKARLTLLGLKVVTQQVESGGQALYRIRVGPYKREDDALGDLDTLAENDFEPRLLKEPVLP